jgi:deferrochelatase/peroxidase EfeB
MVSRRKFLTGAASVAGATALGGGALALDRRGSSDAVTAGAGAGVEPFFGTHQSGIATPQQDRLLFAAFDVTTTQRDDLVALLRRWTDAAARLMAGHDVGEPQANAAAPPTDTGEAVGLDPAHLTLTFGLGPTLFTRDGVDRFGLASRRPAALADLPSFAGDKLDPDRSGGDLCVQACSNDPLVAYHAVRNLARIARGTAVMRWSQQGFGRTSSTTSDQVTPRNLMGFKDGTNNLHAATSAFDRHVWVRSDDGPAWMTGGSYLVARRIRMRIEIWDRSSLTDQERTIGRTKGEGAPLGGVHERDAIDLARNDEKGDPVVPVDAHVRLANQEATGIHILRRGYSFTDGTDPVTGQLDAGLFFLAYQRDPRTQFVELQRKLATDALNEYIQHVSSALFAVPPGVSRSGDALGAALFA